MSTHSCPLASGGATAGADPTGSRVGEQSPESGFDVALGEEDDMTGASARAVRFDRYGGRDVLYVAEVPMPTPATDEVVVAVKAAGINPGETAIRSGALAERFPA